MSDIGRFLVVYDGATEEVLELEEILEPDLDALKELFDVPPVDSEMHDKYALSPEEATSISAMVGKDIDFDFTKYAYFVEAIRKE